jgi:DNA-binding transcriptional regulator YdaS (Cro superfamily)
MLLKDWLDREKMKRTHFAERIGVSSSYVTQICDGTLWPGREIVGRIAEVTGGEVTANDFMARPETAA